MSVTYHLEIVIGVIGGSHVTETQKMKSVKRFDEKTGKPYMKALSDGVVTRVGTCEFDESLTEVVEMLSDTYYNKSLADTPLLLADLRTQWGKERFDHDGAQDYALTPPQVLICIPFEARSDRLEDDHTFSVTPAALQKKM